MVKNQPILPLIAGLGFWALQACGITHHDTKTFTITQTTIPVNGPVVYDTMNQAVDAFKGSYSELTPRYIKVNSVDQLHHLHKGIYVTAKNKPVILYSRGYRGVLSPLLVPNYDSGQAFITACKYIEFGLVHNPIVSFDYLDNWNNFDPSVTLRKERLNFALNALQKKNNKIILMGDCLGAKSMLSLAEINSYQNVCALVAESPAGCFGCMAENIAEKKLDLPESAKEPLRTMLENIFPSYDKDKENLLELAQRIPTDIPIFLGHLHNDLLITDQTAQEIAHTLRDSGHTVYFLVVDYPESTHSRVAGSMPYRKALNAFYKKYELPYDAALAQEGEEILERALNNSQSSIIEHIEQT